MQSISTYSLAYGQFGSASGSLGPWPFSNFGVQASTNLATDVAAGVQGSTQFTFPTIQAGDIFHAGTSQINYDYSADWTNATISSHSGLSASASFNYDIGPFSGSKSGDGDRRAVVAHATAQQRAPASRTGFSGARGGRCDAVPLL